MPIAVAANVHGVELRPDVGAWFTGRDLAGDGQGAEGGGNLAHRRPHRPDDLARAREAVGRSTGVAPTSWHLMQQVHGRNVAVVTDSTPPGAELRGVDALVTTAHDRGLVVQVADCVPVLVAGERTVAAIHAGRSGVAAGVIDATLDAIATLGEDSGSLRAAIGPAIGGCCYEVPPSMRDHLAAVIPEAAATTRWGTASLDLPGAVARQLARAGVDVVEHLAACTRCDPDGRWFSHRADPASVRQIGLVVRRSSAGTGRGAEVGS